MVLFVEPLCGAEGLAGQFVRVNSFEDSGASRLSSEEDLAGLLTVRVNSFAIHGNIIDMLRVDLFTTHSLLLMARLRHTAPLHRPPPRRR